MKQSLTVLRCFSCRVRLDHARFSLQINFLPLSLSSQQQFAQSVYSSENRYASNAMPSSITERFIAMPVQVQ